jgi:superfamily II DNA or RNA helicase
MQNQESPIEKLLGYQKEHVESIIGSLVSYNRALDTSDTGTGKTFTSVCVCKTIGWKPLIVCPKSVIESWLKVLETFKCDFYGIVNYESFQNCNYFGPDGSKIKAKFLVREQVEKKVTDDPLGLDSDSDSDDEKIKYDYKWIENEIPQDILFIFDESHRCKNIKTNNGKILFNLAKIKSVKVLLLSATVVDKPKLFILTGFVLGLFEDIAKGRNFIKKLDVNTANPMLPIHKKIYPEYASRMKIKSEEIKNNFPECKIEAEPHQMDNAVEIQAAYNDIKEATEQLKKQEAGSCALARIIYARQRIELLKVPTFIKLTQEHIAEGKSVAIFVNFTDTLLSLSEKLNTKCLIYGEQDIKDRNKNIEDFQADKQRIIICNMKSGSTGISFHDLNGNFPRVSIISPTWSAQDLVQALGRIFRAKAKSKVVQRIIFCKGTIEDSICKNLADKIANIAFINDGSMESYNFKGLTDEIAGESNELKELFGELPEQPVDKFNNVFEKINKLYEKKAILNKELELLNKEIQEQEAIMNGLF